MQTLLNKRRWAYCQYAKLPVEQLSDDQLLARKTKTRQMMGVVVLLMLLVTMMSFITDQFFLVSTTAAMIPALDEYAKKRKTIIKEIQKRNRR